MANLKFIIKISTIIAMVGILSGCATTKSPKFGANLIQDPGQGLGQGPGQGLGSDQIEIASGKDIVKAFDGGILPKEAFKKLSRKDRTRALLAEYRALENSKTGQAVTWQDPNGKASGSVTAAAPYQVGEQNCRQYTHSASISGRPVEGSGAACRSFDGKWVPLR